MTEFGYEISTKGYSSIPGFNDYMIKEAKEGRCGKLINSKTMRILRTFDKPDTRPLLLKNSFNKSSTTSLMSIYRKLGWLDSQKNINEFDRINKFSNYGIKLSKDGKKGIIMNLTTFIVIAEFDNPNEYRRIKMIGDDGVRHETTIKKIYASQYTDNYIEKDYNMYETIPGGYDYTYMIRYPVNEMPGRIINGETGYILIEFSELELYKKVYFRKNGKQVLTSINQIDRMLRPTVFIDNFVWKYIPGTNKEYAASIHGEIFSVKSNKKMEFDIDHNGYKIICLSLNGKKIRRSVHKLVAITFLPNPNGYDQINHKNENKLDNSVDNLEWCTSKYNANYGSRNENILKSKFKFEDNRILLFMKLFLSSPNNIYAKNPANIDDGICFDEDFCNVNVNEMKTHYFM